MQTLNSELIVEYLEKYAVAPSPSRDYYGIKVLKDQVKLYIWKISHGPHKNPIHRVAKFCDFNRDKTMQNDIQRIFGDRLLQHVRDIVQGKEGSLLTLPKNLIKKITVYLGLKDVLNLAKVSRMANEVFDGDGVWEVLYKRHKMGLVCRDEREQGSSHGWKKLFKERQLHKPARDRKLKKPSSDHRLLSQPIGAKLTRPSTVGVDLPLKNRTASASDVKLFRRKRITNDNPKSAERSSEIDYQNSGINIGREESARIPKSDLKTFEDPGCSLPVKKMVKKSTPREKARTLKIAPINENYEKISAKMQENIERRSKISLHGAKKIQSITPAQKISEMNAKQKTDKISRREISVKKNYSGVRLDAKEDFGLDDLIRTSITDKSLSCERILRSSREDKSNNNHVTCAAVIRRKFPTPEKPETAAGEGMKNTPRETETVRKRRESVRKFLSKGDCEERKFSGKIKTRIKSVSTKEKIIPDIITRNKGRDLERIAKSCEKFDPRLINRAVESTMLRKSKNVKRAAV